jgi:hypothetical protein
LTAAIAAAFDPSVIRSFLTALALRNARIRVITETAPELDRHVHPKEDAPRASSFLDLFDNLDDTARYAVFDFYIDKIDSVERGLKKEFARVFRQ